MKTKKERPTPPTFRVVNMARLLFDARLKLAKTKEGRQEMVEGFAECVDDAAYVVDEITRPRY